MTTCFDIGGTFIRHGSLAKDGLVAEEGRLKTPTDDWAAFVEAVRSRSGALGEPVSISLAGAFDARSGIADVANIPCLHQRHVQDELEQALERPVAIINDANAFALAEAVSGTGRGKDVVFGIILGSGVGGGLVVAGNLVTGFGGMAGEWGHGPIVDPTAGGTIEGIEHYACGCGQTGCVDATGSARGMERIHTSLHGETRSSREITQAWNGNDTKASRTIDAYSTLVSRALSVLVNTFGPDVIPVSGGLSNDEALLDLIDRKTRALVLANYSDRLIVKGAFAENGGLQGAGIHARRMFGETA
ncbi:ROK family protein [uncultured Roseibium sp.]|uniref:ROK family protein n=1 Tax=uncultured Roseibium sp. TaxID=1936171 RepID=UPI00262D17CA|nr:ROK family protein [uncultured Roseibium sp.]